MHIPDGYLSPATCAVFYGAMLPVWYLASRKSEKAVRHGDLALVALGASFVFVIQMFNFPVPGGSSGHMAGGAVLGIVLGPWAAVVAMSLALALQALMFGDGGVLTLGANCFNMALVMTLAGWSVYRVVAAGSPGAARRLVAAALAAYVAVNLSALAAGVELGLQPLLASGPDARPLYSPYPLEIAVPAMALTHLMFFGPVEAVGTALVVSWAARMGLMPADRDKGRSGSYGPLWAALAVLALLVPLGLLATGVPWGEWGTEELGSLVGFVPSGMERLGGAWEGLLPDYGQGASSNRALLYVLSALAGSAALVAVVFLWSRLWKR